MSKTRYSVYFAPAEASELERVCASILGRCARTDKILKQPELPGLNPSRLAELTASPRHYGLHGTLKPPFFLAEETQEADLVTATGLLAVRWKAFHLPPLRLETIGSFLALIPSAPCPELQALARACVTELDIFRRPAPPEELARRRAQGLSPEQARLLVRWGYPYVLEEFRFHLTLTSSIQNAQERELIRSALAPLLAPFALRQVPVQSISLFRQPQPDEAFTVMREFELA